MAQQPNRISHADFFRLCQFVKKEYKASNLSNPKFAEHAAKTLGFPVAPSSITTALEAQGMKSNKEPRGVQSSPEQKLSNKALENRIYRAEKRMSALEGVLLSLQVELGIKK